MECHLRIKNYNVDGTQPFNENNKINSKVIKKVDDDAKQLIIDTLNNHETRGFDVDSIYFTEKGWVIIEFLKCDTYKPHDSHPNKYWKRAFRKVMSLWELTKKLDGRFFWITYEIPYNQFSVIEFLEIDVNHGITKETRHNTNFDGFQKWYQTVNSKAVPVW